MPEEPYLYTHLTAPEYLRLVGRLRGIAAAPLDAAIESLLRLLDLEHAAHGVMTSFSKGMRQRVLVAAALLHDPDLLILDEPFSGLDVSASLLLRALLQALAERGKMILLSSHQMQLVETLCARVVILHKGQIVAAGTPRELESARKSQSLEEVFALVTEQEDYRARVNALLDAVYPADHRLGQKPDPPMTGSFKVLTRHFVDAALAPEVLTEAGADYLRRTLFGVAAVLLVVGIFVTRAFFDKYTQLGNVVGSRAYLSAVQADTLFMIALPMLLVGLAAVVAGPLLFPDETDYRVLTPLPISRAQLFLAKLAAVAAHRGRGHRGRERHHHVLVSDRD